MTADERQCAYCGATGWKGWMVKVDYTDPATHCGTIGWVHAWCTTSYDKAKTAARRKSYGRSSLTSESTA